MCERGSEVEWSKEKMGLRRKHAELVVEASQHGDNTMMGVRGFVAESTTTLLDFGFQGWSLKATLKKLSVAAESASHLLWMTHSHTLPPSTMPKYS